MESLVEGNGFAGLRATRVARWRYLGVLLLQSSITMLLSLAIVKILSFYSTDLVIMADSAKRSFNVWITGLTIALGLSLANSLGKLAKDARWYILSRRFRSSRKIEIMLYADDTFSILRLVFTTRRITFHVVAIAWLCVLIAVQVGLAVLGLFYSVDESRDLALMVSYGNVSIANMSAVTTLGLTFPDDTSRREEEYSMNIYGVMSLTLMGDQRENEPTVGRLRSSSDPVIFCDYDMCDFIFLESSASDPDQDEADGAEQSLTVMTDRRVSIRTTCDSYAVTSGGDGRAHEIEYRLNSSDTDRGRLRVPQISDPSHTVYMTDTSAYCGRGCSTLFVFQPSDDGVPWLYMCNTTIGSVENATMPQHELSDELRHLAGQAIALNGYGSLLDPSNDTTTTQQQSYPLASLFGARLSGDSRTLAFLISRFASGAIAMVARTSPQIIVPGYVPSKGSTLSVDNWQYVSFILIAAVGLQLALSALAAIMATKVVIPPGGATAIARLMQPMLAANEDIDKKEWVYRCRKVSDDGVYDLSFEGRLRNRGENNVGEK